MAPRKKPTRTTKRTKQVEEIYEPIAASSENAGRPPRKYLVPVVLVLVIIGLLYLFRGMYLAAAVNGQPIGRMTVIKELEKQSGKQALENIVTKTLVMQDAKKKNITINDKDIDAQIKKIETNVKAQGMSLDQLLQAQGMKKADMREQVKLQLTAQKLSGQVTVTNKEIDDYIATNKEQLQQNPDQEVSKTQIKDQLTQQKQQQKTQEYISKLRKGAKVTYFTTY